MKFSCVKENLERALFLAERFTGKNVTLPILGNVLLEAEGAELFITATNLEYGIRVSVPGNGSRGGRASVPAKILSSLLQSLREEKLELEEKQGNVTLKTDSRDIKINGMNPDDFPLLPKIKKTASFSVENSALKHAVEKVIPAVSPSEFKPELAGVFFKISGAVLHCAATDTFRLAEKKVELERKIEGGTVSFILPYRVSQELVRVSDEVDEEEVKISLGENQILFEMGRAKIVSRLIEGAFPEYSGIIPKNYEGTAYINRADFTSAVRGSTVFASKLQDVTLMVGKNKAEIVASNPEVGEYKTELAAAFNGKETKISFNHRYLLDGLNALEDEEIFVGLNGTNAPALLQNKSDGSFIYVVMPIRTS